MGNDLTISVIIITRNRAESLKETLTSLTKQSRPPDEVIVVDNASEDHTRDAVLNFNSGLNIKYIYEEKRGIPHARNAGIQNSTGDILASIDDDCIADEDWLKYTEIPFVKDPNLGVLGGEVSYFKMDNGSVESFYMKNMISRGRK